MPKSPTGPFWFIQEGNKLIECTKAEFDKAITEGKSIRYNGYSDKRTKQIAEALEKSRMLFLSNSNLSIRFKSVLTNPANVVQVQIIDVYDPEFWIKEAKNPKYQK